jgi:hypothetical protein
VNKKEDPTPVHGQVVQAKDVLFERELKAQCLRPIHLDREQVYRLRDGLEIVSAIQESTRLLYVVNTDLRESIEAARSKAPNRQLVGSVRIQRFPVKKSPALGKLQRASDWIPIPRTRKLVKKMVADQAEHMTKLAAEGRRLTLWWTIAWTWVLLGWYGITHPIMQLLKAIRGRTAS